MARKKKKILTEKWLNDRAKRSTWYASKEFFTKKRKDPLELKLEEEEENFNTFQQMSKKDLTGFGKDG